MTGKTYTPLSRSITMYTMNEALARDRMREHLYGARHARLARELAAAERWHRWQSRARAAERRHAQRAERVAFTAVAEAR
jgi:hypothetical protein